MFIYREYHDRNRVGTQQGWGKWICACKAKITIAHKKNTVEQVKPKQVAIKGGVAKMAGNFKFVNMVYKAIL